mmetsp:Transcript_38098/g.88658  ORF Transcript_38098/g.88658 Transcript_38098/m.88658 type:complete len:97 (+) Transcript_38098:2548-2838(+)
MVVSHVKDEIKQNVLKKFFNCYNTFDRKIGFEHVVIEKRADLHKLHCLFSTKYPQFNNGDNYDRLCKSHQLQPFNIKSEIPNIWSHILRFSSILKK